MVKRSRLRRSRRDDNDGRVQDGVHSDGGQARQCNGVASSSSGTEPMDEGDIAPRSFYSPRIVTDTQDCLQKLSLEVLCHILSYLPLVDIMKMECQSKKLQEAVAMHLRLLHEVDFAEGQLYGWMPEGFNDNNFKNFIKRCPDIIYLWGLSPRHIAKRRQRGQDVLSIPGIIAALQTCIKLRGVEICDIFLLEGILTYLPNLDILRTFRNRNGLFPISLSNKFELARNPRITSLYLSGVVIPEIPRMDYVRTMHLKWVKLTNDHPFTDFGVPLLQTFVMKNCAGPTNALKYVPLVTGLAAARSLVRLELVRVPFLGGLIQHVVEDSWRMQGFRALQKILLGTCKHALEVDLGYLLATCANRIEDIAVQPSLTKDSFFSSLLLAEVDFPRLKSLHLGYVDDFPEHGKWTNDELVKFGLADVSENPAMITDIGVKVAVQTFSEMKFLHIYNCPHLHKPTTWMGPGLQYVRELHIRRCHAVLLPNFCHFIPMMHCLETLYLEQMFREPPKGCSRVGLSAGTGLGVSSAFVSNTGNDGPANQDGAGANQAQANAPAAPPPVNQPAAPPAPPVSDNDTDSDSGLDEDVDDSSGVNQGVQVPPRSEESPDECPKASGGIRCNCEGSPSRFVSNEVSVQSTLDEPDMPSCSNTSQDVEEDCVNGSGTQHICEEQLSTDTTPDKNPSNKESAVRDLDVSLISAKEHALHCANLHDKGVCGRTTRSASNKSHESVSAENITKPREELVPIGGKALQDQHRQTNKHKGATCAEERSEEERMDTEPSNDISMDTSCSKSSEKDTSTNNAAPVCPNPACRLKSQRQKSETRRTSRSETNDDGQQDLGTLSDTESSKPYKGKGKSLAGNKRSVVKRSTRSSNQVHQSCQAVSEEIREMTKKAKESGPSEGDASNLSPTSISGLDKQDLWDDTKAVQTNKKPCSHTSASQASSARGIGKSSQKKKVITHNKSTSTSDPVIEDDHWQALAINSNSLRNLSLRHVGVTDLNLVACPRLESVSGSACRVLKSIHIDEAPLLRHVSFMQCRKVRHHLLINQLCMQPPAQSRLIILRPMRDYYAETLERLLFSSQMYEYHVCLIHDDTCVPELALTNRMRCASWLDLFLSINQRVLSDCQARAAETSSDNRGRYPWGRNLHRMQGKNADGSSWDLMADIPWLNTLSAAVGKNSTPEMQQKGLYDPETKEHHGYASCKDVLSQDIAEVVEGGVQLFRHTVIVYINLCDLNEDEPVTDEYV